MRHTNPLRQAASTSNLSGKISVIMRKVLFCSRVLMQYSVIRFCPCILAQGKRYGLMQCQLWRYVTRDKKTFRLENIKPLTQGYGSWVQEENQLSASAHIHTTTGVKHWEEKTCFFLFFFSIKSPTNLEAPSSDDIWTCQTCQLQLDEERTAEFAATHWGCGFKVWKGF